MNDVKEQPIRQVRAWKKLTAYLLIIAACLTIAHFSPLHHYLHMETIRELSTDLGWKAVGIISIYAFVGPLFFLPRWPVAVACGMLYGIVNGALLANLLSTIGAWVQFITSRFFLSGTGEKLKEKTLLSKMRMNGQNHFTALFLIRVFPLSNSSATNLLAGTLNFRQHTFVLATFLGMIPTTALYTTWGKLLKKPDPWFYALAIGVAILLAVSVVIAQQRLPSWLYGSMKKTLPDEKADIEKPGALSDQA